MMIARILVEQVAYREPRAQEGTKALVEVDECVGRRIVRVPAIDLEDEVPRLRRAEPFALEREKAELVDDVDAAELARSLERVDDLRRGLEADVLGPQVAVTFDDSGFAHARLERSLALDHTALPRSDALDDVERQSEFGPAQLALGRPDDLVQMPAIRLLVDGYRGLRIDAT